MVGPSGGSGSSSGDAGPSRDYARAGGSSSNSSMPSAPNAPASGLPTTSTTAASALAIPSPSHLNIASNTAPGGLSPIARHARGAFDSTPSFSSPLAYASTLPNEQAEDLELDPQVIAEDDETASRKSDSTVNSIHSTAAPTSARKASSSSYKHYSPHTAETYESTDEERQSSVFDTPTPIDAASVRRERSTSARARLLAWDKQDAASSHSIKSGSPGILQPFQAPVGHSRRKSQASNTIMGPPLTIPRKPSAGVSSISSSDSSSRLEADGFSRISSSRIPSGMSDSSQRSVSNSSTASAEGSASSSTSWQAPYAVSNLAPRASQAVPIADKGIPTASRRVRANTSASVSGIHRRAKSMGGSMLGEAASPIGGPDGVDPDLVAAIRAGDSNIPGPLSGLESSISRLSIGGDAWNNPPAVSPTSRIASLPSTPHGSVRLPSTRAAGDHLSSGVDAKAASGTHPTLQIPRREQSDGNSSSQVSPTDTSGNVGPQDSSRTRARSQTLSPPTADSASLPPPGASGLSASFNPSHSAGASSRANAPLGDAIRLQKMPSNIRSAGDFYSRSDSTSRLHPSASQGGSNAAASSMIGHGLGIGMSTSPDTRLPVPPQTPIVSRSASPLLASELTRSSSISSTSGRSSPVQPARRREQTLGTATDGQSGGEPSPLTVNIPLFSSQDTRLESLSALPAMSYRSGVPASPLVGRGAANMGPPSSAQLSMSLSASQSAFAPLLAMPSPQFERPRGPRGSLFSDASENEYAHEPMSRPAPWIASSQEVRRGSSNTTLKAALTQRSRASMSTTMGSGAFEVQSAAARNNSIRSKETRRISVAPAPQGIDDYARIIVQSRNAKMQKWRTMGKHKSPYHTEIRSALSDMRGSLRESSSRGLLQPWDQPGVPLDRTASADHLPSEIATPNVSPAGSQSAHQEEDLHQLTETAGRREIEWVDWLDEYRKMKEAKLRSEKEEIETQRREEEEAEVSLELEVLPISQGATPTTATSRDFPALPTMSRSTEPSVSSLSQSLSSSMGIPDSKRGSRPRRPSEMPRFTARQDASIRRSSSNAYFSSGSKDSGSYEGSTSPVDRRASIFGDKNRTLSLSPINSRLGNSPSQHGGFGANAAAASSSKRKKMLGGKIEAWWGAVKSGFGGTPSSLIGMSSMQPPMPSPHSGFSSHSGKSIPSSRSKEARQPRDVPTPSNDLYSIFGPQSYGTPHNRSNTLQVPAHEAAETQSVHMLRAASSAQNLRLGESEGDEIPSSDRLADSISEEASKRSSTGTAHAVPLLTPAAQEAEEDTTLPDEKGPGEDDESATQQKKSASKASHLSLHLLHGQSAFDAAPFEKLSSSRSGTSSAPADQTKTLPTDDESKESAFPSAPAATPSNREEKRKKTLSDSWKPEAGEKESKAQQPQPHRGRSSQRHDQKGKAEDRASSKDFTINSIRQHIHNRLTSSKEAFDRELKKIIHSINAYVEEALQEQLLVDEPELVSEQGGEPGDDSIDTVPDRDTSLEASLGLLTLGDAALAVPPPGDVSGDSNDADRTAQPESEDHTEAPTPRPSRDAEDATGSTSAAAQQEYTLPSPPHARKPSMAALLPGRSVSRSTTLSRQSRHGDALSTSRSTSRSHSPMPGATLHGVQAAESPQYSPARRLRQLDAEEAPVEPFVAALQDLVAIAMDVYDTSIYTLTSTSGACSEIISQVQAVGRRWDENPQWDGRGWYVQLLLAVAGLSRVVEWWEAEKGFWKFQDEAEQGSKGDAEPIRFIFGNSAAAADGGHEYGDYSLSSARSAVSTSPSRVRQMNPQQILSLTPSQHSSAHSSPALEPWDRRVVSEGDRGKVSLAKATIDAADGGSSKAEEGTPMPVPADGGAHKKESQNVVMELSLVEERFLYVSPAWRKVMGSDPVDVLDLPIEEVLAPGDASTFAQATEQLQANDAHTVEVAFRLQVRPTELEEAGMTYYQEMEGKGMLMHDRQSAMPSHTMWVFKPVGSPEAETDLAPGPQKPAAGAGEPPVVTEAAGATAATQILISTEPLLCRICERDVPTWFFEKHSEICNEIHRLEMEISEYNEGLAELRRTARTIVQAIDDLERTEAIEYRNLLLSTPPAMIGPPSALEVANRSITPRQLNPAAIRKTHLRALDSILSILRTAASISTPAVKDDTASDPIEKQRLLSPDSEDRIVQVRNWKRIACEDAALDLLATDVETAMRSKLSAVNRMLNTIVYVETVRMEWEGRVEAALGQVREESDSGESVGNATEEQELDSTPSRQQMGEDDDVEERGAAAVLLDTYEPDATRSTSTSLSARRDLPGGEREEDIPGVESELGGSVMENISPIPIPASQRSSSVRGPHRQMMRDPSSTSSFGVESLHSPAPPSPAGLRLDTHPSMARSLNREGLLSSEARGHSSTPPLSPRHSPAADMSIVRPKDRRISVTQRNGLHSPYLSGMTPLSPRIPPAAPSSRPTASSIKDFDIIKPISKGAFGSVFLAKKRTTGDYYAIKVLKKSDMIAKNQITNVKAERMILMTQTQSPFVVKLFFTFQSSEYLYLVMEYLPGGDCANLCKALGGLPEDWTKQYIAEVVNGLEMLHSKGVVHRDMKPDNLLIDQKGHLKLTDFGLSKIGLLGRQNRQSLATTKAGSAQPAAESVGGHSKKSSISSSTASSPAGHIAIPAQNPPTSRARVPETPLSLSIAQSQNFFVGLPPAARGRIMSASTDASDSSGSDSPMAVAGAKQVPVVPASALLDSPSHIFGPHMMAESQSNSAGIHHSSGSGGAQTKKFVGTPDYLAPESILGLGMDDAAVDWWALGVILYEFLYGFPPFHADTPEKVFDNILSRNIEWDDEDGEASQVSAPARDLMEKLMCTDRKHRLGAGEKGAADIKAHPFFEGIDWDNLTKVEGPFVPQITDAESTDYFDLRGAVYQEFSQEEQEGDASKQRVHSTGFHREFAKALEGKRSIEPSRPPSRYRMRIDRNKTQDSSSGAPDDFGSFSFKNLPMLKQANDEVVKKMRGDQLSSMSSAMMDQSTHNRHRSLSGKVTTPGQHRASALFLTGNGPPSPSTSVSSQSSVPSKSTAPTSPSGAPFAGSGAHHLPSLHHHLSGQPHHRRRPSELSSAGGASSVAAGSPTSATVAILMERKRSLLNDGDSIRRTSMPTRLRTDSTGVLTDKMSASPGASSQVVQSSASTSTGSPSHRSSSAALDAGEKLKEEGPVERQQTTAEGTSEETAISPTTTSGQLTCLIAEDNPISLKMLEHVLSKLGCNVTSVRNGAEALRLAMGDTKFALLFVDASLPIVNGQDVARMIKSTRNINSATPIIGLSNEDAASLVDLTGNVFDAALVKPVERSDLCNVLPQLGFKPMLATSASATASRSASGSGPSQDIRT